MEEEVKERLIDAYRRIDQCLDGRREKDVRLYLPIEDIEELKKIIYEGKYEKVLEKFRLKKERYSADVLANILIKNAWLMKDDGKYGILHPVFKECEIAYFSAIMNDGILDHTIEMPKKFRANIILLYLKRLDGSTCRKMLDENPLFLNDINFRAVCIVSILKEMALEERYRAFNNYVKKWPGLLEVTTAYKDVFPKDKINEEDFCELIFSGQIVDNQRSLLNDFWINMLTVDGLKIILTLLNNYFRSHASDSAKGKTIVSKLFPVINRDLDKLADDFVNACTSLDHPACKTVLQEFCKRIQSPRAKDIMIQALQEQGIQIEHKENTLADADTIAEKLSGYRISDKLMGFLVISFSKQYKDDYEFMLSKIQTECSSDDNFNLFVYELAVRRLSSYPNYMMYLLEYIVPSDPRIKKKCLEFFEGQDILREKKKMD